MARNRHQPFDLSAAANDPDPDRAASPELDIPPVGSLRRLEPYAASDEEGLGFADNAYTVALASGLVWAGALTAYTLFDRASGARFGDGPLWLLVFGGVVALPIAFMLLAAYATRQAAQIATETRRTRRLAGEWITPAAAAASGATDALGAVRAAIGEATKASSEAGESLTRLREGLAEESKALTRSAAEANRATGRLTTAFSRERQDLELMVGQVDGAVQSTDAAIGRQSAMIAEAADLARGAAESARAEVSAQAAQLSGAVNEAARTAVDAAGALAGQTDRLERASAFLGERYRGLETALDDRHQALQGLTASLGEEQAHADAVLEAQRARLAEASAEARATAELIARAAQDCAGALQAIEGAADRQAASLAASARAHQDALERRARETLGFLDAGLAAARQAAEAEAEAAVQRLTAKLDAARAAAAERTAQAEQAAVDRIRTEVERLEDAGRRAREQAAAAAEAALAHARRLIDDVSGLAEEAGALAASRIGAGLQGARAAAGELQQLLAEVDRHAAAIPAQVRTEVDNARRALAELAEPRLTPVPAARVTTPDQAAKPAEPPAFAAAPRPVAPSPAPADIWTARVAPAKPLPHTPPSARALEPLTFGVAREPAPAPPTPPQPSPVSAEAAGLRPRLKLTPSTPDPAPEPDPFDDGLDDLAAPILFDRTLRGGGSPSQPPQSAPERERDDWTWNDLLASTDATPDPESAEEADGELIAEIAAMGVDPGALLPTSRLDEVSRALHAGDPGRARDLVSRAAPAAIRRLSRRVLTDKILRAQADRHVRHYQQLLADSTRSDREGHRVSALLSTDPGRTYLLLDAAFQEMG